MSRKTRDVKDFFEEVVWALPNPLVDDATDQVFLAIERSPRRRRQYDLLCRRHTQRVVHSQGPQWIRKALGMPTKTGKGIAKSKLIPHDQYSKFDVATMVPRPIAQAVATRASAHSVRVRRSRPKGP